VVAAVGWGEIGATLAVCLGVAVVVVQGWMGFVFFAWVHWGAPFFVMSGLFLGWVWGSLHIYIKEMIKT